MTSDDRDTKPPREAADDARMTPSTETLSVAAAKASHAVLVLGMHRSGTSAVARVLALMGADTGPREDLLPAHPTDNPTGYWERADLNAIHDRFLESTGHGWNRVAGFDPHSVDAEACAAFAQQLRGVVKKLDGTGTTWLAKDPRLCLLLAQWRPLLDKPAYVVVVRDPREIAASMSSGPRGTFTSPFVIALWEKYLRTVLGELDGERALFVSYADLLAHPQPQCTRLLKGLRELGVADLHEAPARELSGFLDPQLKRSTPREHVQMSPAQSDLLRWLQTQCRAKGPVKVAGIPQAPAPDAVLAEYEAAFDFHVAHGRGIASQEVNQRLVAIEAQIAASHREREQRAAEVAREREQRAAEVAREREQRAAEMARERELRTAEMAREREQHARELAQRAADAAREREKWMADLNALRQQNAAVTQNATQLRAELADTQRQHAATSAQLEQLTRHSGVQDKRVHDLNQHATAVSTKLEKLTAHASAQDQRVHELNLASAALEERERALRASLSWKLTAPLRGVASVFSVRPSGRFEQSLYRAYYSMPGMSAARKRALVEWLHRRAGWLTRNTLSYQLHTQAQQLKGTDDAAASATPKQAPRMDQKRADAVIATLADPPLISIVMPVYNVDRRWLMAAVESVRRQFYPHWQLCIADDASTRVETRDSLREIAQLGDARIKIDRLTQNRGIAGASNAALQMATGDYVGLLDNDDELTRDALLEAAQTIVASNADIVYSDEDKLDTDGSHVEPHFKPDFNIDYFLSINYVCHFAVIRRGLLERIGGFRQGFDGAQDYDLLLRASESAEKIAHIPKVLYHWRKTAESTATASSAKPKSWDAGQRALSESVARRGIEADVEPGPYPNTYRVRRRIEGQPLVSILVPFRDKPELLSTCVQSILDKTDYANFEIIGIDNGSTADATHALMKQLERRDSRVRFVRHDAPFNFSAINNFGARHASGEHLLLLNNDTEVIAAGWLRAMLEHSQRPEVGVVGAKLLYPDRRIQHAGVIVGIGGVAGHAHLLVPGDHPGYFARAQLPQNFSAVTFACAMTRRDVFEQVGGLNETDLSIAFNDIDYCLRVREAGYLIVYTPFAELFHYESLSRGYEDNPEKQARFSREARYMMQRHREILRRGDPCYNPNLRLDTHDFSPLPGYIDALPR